MAEGVNVRLSGKLQEFVRLKSAPDKGGFSSASEYIAESPHSRRSISEDRFEGGYCASY
jgi:hypothetical protein